jgi:hypothetical protein
MIIVFRFKLFAVDVMIDEREVSLLKITTSDEFVCIHNFVQLVLNKNCSSCVLLIKFLLL